MTYLYVCLYDRFKAFRDGPCLSVVHALSIQRKHGLTNAAFVIKDCSIIVYLSESTAALSPDKRCESTSEPFA
jgi:hypothetical protein